MKILIASGVNLDLLGKREISIYGKDSLQTMEKLLKSNVTDLKKIFKLKSCELVFFQSNDEATFLEEVSKSWDGIVINPGAWTHTSLALADRLVGLGTPYVEVHVSNVFAREEFRKHSFLSPHAVGTISGFGIYSYLLGLQALVTIIQDQLLPQPCPSRR